MRKILTGVLLLALLRTSSAQPPVDHEPQWKIKAGNPVLISEPRGSGGVFGSAINHVSFSLDGALLAAGGGGLEVDSEGIILLRDGRSGTARGQLRGHKDRVTRLEWAPDGKTLASQSEDGAIVLWDIAARSVRHRLNEGKKAVRIHAGDDMQNIRKMLMAPRLRIGGWSPDGATLAACETRRDKGGSTATIKLYNAANGQLELSLPPLDATFSRLAWTPDGKHILFPSNRLPGLAGAIDFLDARTGTVVRTVARSDAYISVLAFDSPRMRALIRRIQTGEGQAGSEVVSLWDLTEDRPLWTQTLPVGTVRRAAFSRDGKSLIVNGTSGDIVPRDIATGAASRSVPASLTSEMADLDLSPDGLRAATAAGAPSLQLWKLNEAVAGPRFASETVLRDVANVRALAWHGNTVTVISERGSYEKNLRKGKELRIITWDAAKGTTATRSIPVTNLMSRGDISTDGSHLAIETGIQPRPVFYEPVGISVYSLLKAELVRTSPAAAGMSEPVWSPDGKTIASRKNDGTITLWDAFTGETRQTLRSRAMAIAWSPDSKTIAVVTAEGIDLFNVESGERRAGWQVTGATRAVSFAPHGKTLAVGVNARPVMDFGTTTVELFDVASGAPKRSFPVQQAIRDLHWTPDGTSIAATSYDNPNRGLNGQLNVWDADTGAERVLIEDVSGLESFAFSPDGGRVAVSDGNTIRVWTFQK